MKFNRNEFVGAFSLALDFLESSLRTNITNHGRRVAFIALSIGKSLGLGPEDMFDLYAGAMLHDNGITYAIYEAMKSEKYSLEDFSTHCLTGESNLRAFPFLKNRENMILYHHENYDGSGFFGIAGAKIPLFAHIIYIADEIEILYSKGHDRAYILSQVKLWKNKKIDAELCEAFEALAASLGFWLTLDNRFIVSELKKITPQYEMDLSLEELLPIAGIFSKMIDEKSPFTGRHSQGIAEKAALMSDYYGFDTPHKQKLVLAAYLHDAGKLAVPNAVLDKPGPLNDEEFAQVQPHTFYTRRMLESIAGLEDVTEWASNHHEKLDGTGYPYGLTADQLDFESRLMGCIDIFQALTEERPYRRPLEHATVSKLMRELAGKGVLDKQSTEDTLEELRRCY